MGLTSPDDIFYPDVSIAAAELANLSDMADSIQAALALRARFDFVWPSVTERNAQTGMVDGSRGYQIDTGYDYKYNGSVWRNMTTGLVPVFPTGATGTGVSLGVGGQIILSTVGSVAINGIFSSEFDNYRVDIDIPDSSANLTSAMQLSVGGTADISANYDITALQGVGVTASSTQAIGATSWSLDMGSANTNRVMDISIEFKRPFLTKPTQVIVNGLSNSTTMTTSSAVGVKLFAHRLSTSYDGIKLIFSTGTPVGVVHVYGWNNGAK